MKNLFYSLILLILSTGISIAQNFKVSDKGIFKPQNKKVLLFVDSTNNKKIILFKTKLQVNTDGTPISYNPDDLSGNEKAINTIGNAIAVYRKGSNKNLCLSKETYGEAISVFEKYRDSNYEIIPESYTISWKNVLIPETLNGKEKPCIIKTGEYKGYFASATSLKNDLKTDKGECECNNQVNPLKIPSLVLVGGKDNILKKYGANLGDLVIAYNPINKIIVHAIINDVGPKNNLGEGSVLLNMKLIDKTEFPKNRKDTYKLAIDNDIIITIIPNSKNYNVKKPYTIENINERLEKWLKESGFETQKEFIDFMEQNISNLN